ncbi:MAG: hypothetical protein QOE51_3978, partial [Actinoplanes sp.]|nr:hypothetical protein [Actinoplanes sp.]
MTRLRRFLGGAATALTIAAMGAVLPIAPAS